MEIFVFFGHKPDIEIIITYIVKFRLNFHIKLVPLKNIDILPLTKLFG